MPRGEPHAVPVFIDGIDPPAGDHPRSEARRDVRESSAEPTGIEDSVARTKPSAGEEHEPGALFDLVASPDLAGLAGPFQQLA